MESIFVSVASYRDIQCSKTLKSLFENADNPHNIYVGICQQNDRNVDQECNLLSNEYNNNIRIIRLHHYEAKGPTYARYLCSTLYNNEDYFFQIDSHTKLVKSWDTKCKNMIKYLKENGISQNPVLSHYPNVWNPDNDSDNSQFENTVTKICKSFFNDRGIISFEGAGIISKNNEFSPTPYVAGGFIFSEGKLLNDVPFDPSLDYLFTGEVILNSIRFWTNGYDIFSPNENIAFHEYTRADSPKIWTDQDYNDSDAFEKVKQLIGLSELSYDLINYKYGIGNKRTLQEYYNFAGIDLINKKVNKNFCTGEITSHENDTKNQNTVLFISFGLFGFFCLVLFLIFMVL